MNLVLLVALGALMHATRSFAAGNAGGSAGALLAFGYVLVSAFFAGGLFKQLRLPKLTGYIATGIVAGPMVLNLVSSEMVASLDVVNGIAVAMIGLTAGNEIELRAMRSLLRSIGWITVIGVMGTVVLLATAVWLARPLLPFMHAMGPAQALAVSVVLGVVMVAQSPAVVVALRDELRADGPVSRTVLGVVVIADLLVIVLFSGVSTIAKATFGGGADAVQTAAKLGWEVFGSLLAGAVVGGLLAIYLRKVIGGAAMFVFLMAVVVAEVGRRLHFDPLLVAIAAGMLVRNATKVGDALHHEMQPALLPVSIVFFAVAGANLHLDVFALVGLPAAIFVAVRAAGLLLGSRLGALAAGAPANVQRYAGFGLLPQAGLALALSMLFTTTFPEFGIEASALTLGVVALNELLAPAMYRFALVRCGEVGRVEPSPHDVAAVTPAPLDPGGRAGG
jgi:Kef-type K+ transport system membrane component KefB